MFHAIRTINGMNYMYKYRIASDGRLVLEQRLKGIYLTGQKLDETRKRLIDAGKAVPVKARRGWRKIITDDPNKRIRDYMKETPQVCQMSLDNVLNCYGMESIDLLFEIFRGA